MNVRGHCLFWALPENEPPWLLNANKQTIKQSVIHRLIDVVGRYRDK